MNFHQYPVAFWYCPYNRVIRSRGPSKITQKETLETFDVPRSYPSWCLRSRNKCDYWMWMRRRNVHRGRIKIAIFRSLSWCHYWHVTECNHGRVEFGGGHEYRIRKLGKMSIGHSCINGNLPGLLVKDVERVIQSPRLLMGSLFSNC